VDGLRDKRVTVGEVAKTAQINNWGTIAAADSLRQVSCPPCFMAHFIEVDVNTETGVIKPVRAVIYADAGRVINPDLAEGQLHGGLYRGLGFSLLEDTQHDKETGELTNKGWITDFKMLTADDMPEMEKSLFASTDTHESTGPWQKGSGRLRSIQWPPWRTRSTHAIGIRFTEVRLP
jgi:xanthine dehydrogenase molybdenum-binding subunit